MPSLKEAIATVRDLRLPPLQLPDPPRIIVKVSELDTGGGVDRPRPGKDYQAIAGELMAKLLAGETLSWRELRDAAWCLWSTESALSDEPAALHAVVRGVEASERRRPGRALASSYMATFDQERLGFDLVGGALARMAPRLGRPWSHAHELLAIFDPEVGPARVARAAIDNRKSPPEILETCGFGSFYAQSGFARACCAAALTELSFGAGENHEDRLALVSKIALKDEHILIFQVQAPLVAHALLGPFGTTMPEKSIRDRFLDVLIGLFGDPRLRPGAWTRMPESESIVRRWLTEQSLRQFLDVVDRVALERMWKYRRAFWEAVHEAGLISDAWVVFDRYGAGEARRAFGRTVSFAQFRQGGGQVQHGQAVLLMRIGRGVVAEWSHNGRCHIWSNADASTAPRMSQVSYVRSELRSPSGTSDHVDRAVFSIAHMGAETYRWQSKVATKIHQMTGVRLQTYKYQIRRYER